MVALVVFPTLGCCIAQPTLHGGQRRRIQSPQLALNSIHFGPTPTVVLHLLFWAHNDMPHRCRDLVFRSCGSRSAFYSRKPDLLPLSPAKQPNASLRICIERGYSSKKTSPRRDSSILYGARKEKKGRKFAVEGRYRGPSFLFSEKDCILTRRDAEFRFLEWEILSRRIGGNLIAFKQLSLEVLCWRRNN